MKIELLFNMLICIIIVHFHICITVLSAMIRGADDGDKFIVKDYKVEEMPQIITDFVASI